MRSIERILEPSASPLITAVCFSVLRMFAMACLRCITIIRRCQEFLCYTIMHFMGRKKRQEHAKKRPEAKGKEAGIKNDSPHENGLRNSVSHALSNGWVQNSGIGFLLIGVGLIVAIMTRTQIKAAALTFALAGTLFSWILALFVVRNVEPENPPFALFIQTAIIGDNRGTQLFGEYNGTYLAEIEFILYVKVTNNQASQATISNLNVEVRRKKGWWIFPDRWMPTTPIYRYVRLIWVNPSPKPSQIIKLEPPRLEPVLDKPIAPHETVEGCLLLDVGKEWLSATRPPLYRFSIRDTAGNKAVIIDDVSHGGNQGNAIGLGGIGDIDVSHHTVVHLADFSN